MAEASLDRREERGEETPREQVHRLAREALTTGLDLRRADARFAEHVVGTCSLCFVWRDGVCARLQLDTSIDYIEGIPVYLDGEGGRLDNLAAELIASVSVPLVLSGATVFVAAPNGEEGGEVMTNREAVGRATSHLEGALALLDALDHAGFSQDDAERVSTARSALRVVLRGNQDG